MKIIQKFWFFSVFVILVFLLNSCAPKTASYPPFERMKVLCFGDSITSGFKLRSPGSQSYPAQLQKMSRGKWKVSNLAVPGATTLKKGDLPIWEEKVFDVAMSSKPEAVVMMLGTNDTKNRNWSAISHFSEDYTELVKKMQALPSAPQVFICSVPPVITSHSSGITNKRALILTEKVRTIAETTGSHFVDITTPLAEAAYFFPDGIHPNARGAGVLAETIMDKIINL